MLGPPKARGLDQPVTRSLEELVAPDNFYRHLAAKLDLSFVRDWVADCYAARGRPSIDPVVFFKLQLVLFFEGIRSERQLMRVVADRLSLRWYLGYTLDEPLPDHSSLTRIRERLGLPVFQRFFAHVVELCQQAGLVWGRELLFDSTRVRANADVDSLVPRWYLRAKAHLDDLFVGNGSAPASGMGPDADGAADAPLAEGDRGTSAGAPGAVAEPDAPGRLPFAGEPAAEAQLGAMNQAVWRLLDRLRLDPDRPTTRGYHRTSDDWESTTDPNAAPMRSGAGGLAVLGFQDHYVVDGGKARIILQALITPADVMENIPMPDLLWRVRFRWKLHPRRVIADTRYGTIDNIRLLEDAGIKAYVPLPDFDGRTAYYGPSRFRYDAERDEYRCPQEQPLPRYTAKHTEGGVMYRADAATCNACPVKAACTPSTRGRSLRRSIYTPYLERVRAYHDTPAYQKAMRKRQVWVEPLFGEAKEWHGLRKFRLRGLWKVNCEGLLVAAGQNLKRWLSRTGWGRRYGPAGRGLLALPHGAARCRRSAD